MKPTFEDAANDALGPGRLAADVPLAPFTTFRVGGAADWLAEVRSVNELLSLLAIARTSGVPVTVLGGGSNVIVSDDGVRGLVVRLLLTGIGQPDAGTVRAEAVGRSDADWRPSSPGRGLRARSVAPFTATRTGSAATSATS
jgi:hypothetical protein